MNRGRLRVVHQHGRTERSGTDGVGIRTGQTNGRYRIGSVADTVAVGVGVQGIRTEIVGTVVDAGVRLRKVGSTVAVVVQIFDQITVFGVVLGQFVRLAVAVGVLEHLQEEAEHNRRAGTVAVHREVGFRDDLGGRSADDAGGGVDVQAVGQVGPDFVGYACAGCLRCQGRHHRVVEQVDHAVGGFTERGQVRTGHTDGRHGVGTVADTVVVGVGIERVGARVALVHVGARARLVQVVQTVAVVVLVLNQRRDTR